MKYTICAVFLILVALLVSCQAPDALEESLQHDGPIADASNASEDETQAPSERSDLEENSNAQEQETEFSVLKSTFFDTVEELIAFNQNPSLLDTGNSDQTAWLLAEHKAGTVLSQEHIYIPEIADVSDYIVDADYFLVAIEQTPREISFVYRLKSAPTELDQANSQIRINITWYPNDCNSTEAIESQFGVKKDENGYIFCPDDHVLFLQLEENCYVYVFAPNYPAVFDFLARFTNVQKVNINPNAVTE